MSSKKTTFRPRQTEGGVPFDSSSPYPDAWSAPTFTPPRTSIPFDSYPDEYPLGKRSNEERPACCSSPTTAFSSEDVAKLRRRLSHENAGSLNLPPLLPDETSPLPSSWQKPPSSLGLEPVAIRSAVLKHPTRVVDAAWLQKQTEDYLQAHPNVREAMVWGFGADAWERREHWGDPRFWKNYASWDAPSKKRLHQAIHAFASGQDPFFLNPFELLTYDKCHFLYLHFVAHSLWLEISQAFSWRLHLYPSEQLHWLLHASSLLIYKPEVAGYVLGYHRIWDKEELLRSEEYFLFNEGSSTSLDPAYHLPGYQPRKKWQFSFQAHAQTVPISPSKMLDFFEKIIGVKRSEVVRSALDKTVVWAQWNMNHGQDVLLSNSSGRIVYPAYLTFDFPLISQDVLYEKQETRFDFPPYLGLRTIDPKWVATHGKIASAVEKGWILFCRNPLYQGCQVSGEMLHWLFRSVNIPSLYHPVQISNLKPYEPHAWLTDKGLQVFFEGELRFLVHNDDLYQIQTDKGHRFNFFRPTKPAGIFVSEAFYREWFPFHLGNALHFSESVLEKAFSKTISPLRQHGLIQGDLYYSYMAFWGAVNQCDHYVLQWWEEYDRAGSEALMNVQSIPWVFYYSNNPVPQGFDKQKGLEQALDRVRTRVFDLRTQGVSLAFHKQDFVSWETARTLSQFTGAVPR